MRVWIWFWSPPQRGACGPCPCTRALIFLSRSPRLLLRGLGEALGTGRVTPLTGTSLNSCQRHPARLGARRESRNTQRGFQRSRLSGWSSGNMPVLRVSLLCPHHHCGFSALPTEWPECTEPARRSANGGRPGSRFGAGSAWLARPQAGPFCSRRNLTGVCWAVVQHSTVTRIPEQTDDWPRSSCLWQPSECPGASGLRSAPNPFPRDCAFAVGT